MHRLSTKQLTFTALLAAVYALLTVTLPIPQFSGVQIRFAEALTVLPFLRSEERRVGKECRSRWSPYH